MEEHKKADVCLKCGKGTHKWHDCWSKNLVTTKVVTTKYQQAGKGIKKEDKKEKKEVKILAVKAVKSDEHRGRIIELVEDSNGDYGLLR